jgi:hypothetical protein
VAEKIDENIFGQLVIQLHGPWGAVTGTDEKNAARAICWVGARNYKLLISRVLQGLIFRRTSTTRFARPAQGMALRHWGGPCPALGSQKRLPDLKPVLAAQV